MTTTTNPQPPVTTTPVVPPAALGLWPSYPYYPWAGGCHVGWASKLAAASVGDVVASMIRKYDAEREADGVKTAVDFSVARIDEAEAENNLTAADARRLRALLMPSSVDAPPSAATLFQECWDDPDSSDMALAALSILKLHEERSMLEDDITLSTGELTALVLVSAAVPPFGVGVALGLAGGYVYNHLHVSWE